MQNIINWEGRGKTISGLIKELKSFENQEMEIRISIDGGDTSLPISLVGKFGDVGVLLNCEETPSIRKHEITNPKIKHQKNK